MVIGNSYYTQNKPTVQFSFRFPTKMEVLSEEES